jgi:expansin (peptidoglycan-binding protein)
VFSGGEFHLGPVDWAESEWTNSCSPYPEAIQELEGDFLAGLELTHNGDGQLCDACVELVAETGKSIVARVITTGVTTPNSIDLSPEAFAALDSGEYPRAMTWQVVKCPDTGNLHYQFQTEANVWWTSLWVRNARVPIEKIEVQSANHDDWFALTRGSDGTYTDNSGFGDGPFTLRVTGIDGQTVEDSFDSFSPGDLVESSGNFE